MPARPRRRTPLNRDRVLRAALRLADRGGVAALSMRRLAAALGVEAMSLYRHVDGKEALLDGLLDLVVGEIALPPPAAGWREGMRARALSARRVFRRHPWAVALLEARIHRPTPVRLTCADAVFGLLRRDGFTATMAYRAFLTVDSYLYGFGLQEMHWNVDEAAMPAVAGEMAAQIPAAYPHLRDVMAAAAAAMAASDAGWMDREFEYGLDLILDAVGRLRHQP